MGDLKQEPVTIICDTREQAPYAFEHMEIGTLHIGDYSVKGFENEVAIERKTKSDAYGTIGQGRDRFIRELERMAKMRYAAIVVETSLPDFLIPPDHSSLNPKSAIGSLLSWSVKYNLPIFFCGDRNHAQAVTLKLLQFFHKYNSGPQVKDTPNARNDDA